jgi:hypothetical protein
MAFEIDFSHSAVVPFHGRDECEMPPVWRHRKAAATPHRRVLGQGNREPDGIGAWFDRRRPGDEGDEERDRADAEQGNRGPCCAFAPARLEYRL